MIDFYDALFLGSIVGLCLLVFAVTVADAQDHGERKEMSKPPQDVLNRIAGKTLPEIQGQVVRLSTDAFIEIREKTGVDLYDDKKADELVMAIECLCWAGHLIGAEEGKADARRATLEEVLDKMATASVGSYRAVERMIEAVRAMRDDAGRVT